MILSARTGDGSRARPAVVWQSSKQKWAARCRKSSDIWAFCDPFLQVCDDLEVLLTENRIFKQRNVGIAEVKLADAWGWGFSGVMVRASGAAWDLRKAQPYECYSEMDFDIPIGKNGDCYDRYCVRMEEMRQSIRIMKQCRDRALRTFVVDRLAEGWTPEQISGWLKGGNEPRLRAVGCETIYAFIYRAAQQAEQLWRYLTRHHKRRRPRRSRPSQDTIKDRVSIHERPKHSRLALSPWSALGRHMIGSERRGGSLCAR